MNDENRNPKPEPRTPNYKDLLAAGWLLLCFGAFFSAAWQFFGF